LGNAAVAEIQDPAEWMKNSRRSLVCLREYWWSPFAMIGWWPPIVVGVIHASRVSEPVRSRLGLGSKIAPPDRPLVGSKVAFEFRSAVSFGGRITVSSRRGGTGHRRLWSAKSQM
jgi:hypothetical protein